jgi:transposase-like protein
LFRSVRVKPDDLPNYLRAPNVPYCGHAANMARGGTSFHRPQRALIHLTHYSIETLGKAYQQGWRVRVRCAWGPRDGMKRVRECVHGAELDLQTLVWTRGAAFPVARLESRMKCPRCGSRRVVLLFEPPSTRGRMLGVG